MAYNTTFLDTSNNIYDVAVGVSNASNNLLGVFLVLIVFIIVFAATKEYDVQKQFMTASMVSMFIASLLWFASMVEWYLVITTVTVFLISIMVNAFTKR